MASFVSLFFFLVVSVTNLSLTSSQIVLPLTHSLSKTQFNHTTRFRNRHGHHHHPRQIAVPLSPGKDYTLSFSLDSDPDRTISLYMDTGSDLIWFPCAPFKCIPREGDNRTCSSTTTPPDVSSSAFVPCNSPSCSAIHSSLPSDLCAISRCPLKSIVTGSSECSSFPCPPFYYSYVEGSGLIGRLYHDSISIPMYQNTRHSLSLKNFTFGCSHGAVGLSIGVAGFGRGLLSFPSQLVNRSLLLHNSFSYCLISHPLDARPMSRPQPSPLILGRYSMNDKKGKKSVEDEFQYTPMLNCRYFYCVGLEAVSVGGSRIPTPESLKSVDRNGDGGMVVDSGTTLTELPARLYEVVVAEFDRVYKRARDTEDQTGLGRCYYVDDSVDKATFAKVPELAFHFVGNASIVLPTRNYFFRYTKTVGCLLLMDGGDYATLGNYQQQRFEVIYDLEKERIGFVRKRCATLWDSLNREH